MDIQPLVQKYTDYLKAAAGEQWEKQEAQIKGYANTMNERAIFVMKETTEGKLSGSFLQARLENELGILESEAIAVGIGAAGFAQGVISETVKGLMAIVIDELQKLKFGAERMNY